MKNKKMVVIITTNKYPDEDAGAIRQHAMAKALKDKGYNVFVIGYGKITKKVMLFEDIPYISMRTKSKSCIAKIMARVKFASKAIKYIKSNLDIPYGIIVVDGLPNLFYKTRKFAQKFNIKLVHDSVEWYSPEEYKMGKFSIAYNLKMINNKICIRKPWKVIAISRYLENYYLTKGIKTTRIPVIMNVLETKKVYKKKNEKVIFMYAGVAGRKDYLDIIIEGFAKVPLEYRNAFEFHVFGVNEEQLINKCNVNKEDIINLKDCLFIHGRVNHIEVLKWIKKADYTVLIRNPLLCYAKAGFPTKVVESLTYSTPVICNFSSDLKDYLVDNQNAIIVEKCIGTSFCNAIIRAMDKSFEQHLAMCENARKTAEDNFDYRLYGENLCEILNKEGI